MLDELLQDLLDRIPGSLAAVLVGSDGLVVSNRVRDHCSSFEQVSAQSARLFKSGQDTLEALSDKPLKELVIVSDPNILLLRSIGSSHFILLLLTHTALLGKARYELHKAEEAFIQELS